MIEEVIFSDKQGMGFIADNESEINELIVKKPITINYKELLPDNLTTLEGYLTREVEYLGVLKTNEKIMIFYLGNSEDLFNNKYYYNSIAKIVEDRIFECFGHGFGRDHIFIKGKWK